MSTSCAVYFESRFRIDRARGRTVCTCSMTPTLCAAT